MSARAVARSGSLHVDDVAADATAAIAAVAVWDDTGDRFLAWHCVVTSRLDGCWSGRVTLRGDGSRIGDGSKERRVCRYLPAPAGAIDANIAPVGDHLDVGTPLLGRNILVIAGSERYPGGPRTEPYAP